MGRASSSEAENMVQFVAYSQPFSSRCVMDGNCVKFAMLSVPMRSLLAQIITFLQLVFVVRSSLSRFVWEDAITQFLICTLVIRVPVVEIINFATLSH